MRCKPCVMYPIDQLLAIFLKPKPTPPSYPRSWNNFQEPPCSARKPEPWPMEAMFLVSAGSSHIPHSIPYLPFQPESGWNLVRTTQKQILTGSNWNLLGHQCPAWNLSETNQNQSVLIRRHGTQKSTGKIYKLQNFETLKGFSASNSKGFNQMH